MQPFQAEYADLRKLIDEVGDEKYPGGYERIVFTNGCFDVLHPGHIQTLQFAAEQAGPRGAVIVGLNSDDSVRRSKGNKRPILPEAARAALLSALSCVDHVVSFNEDTPLELIQHIRPDIIVKGGDYELEDIVGKDEAVVMTAPYDDTWSTTKIVDKIIQDWIDIPDGDDW